MNDDEKFDRVVELIGDMHGDQKDKGGESYVGHLFRVAHCVPDYLVNVALAHDLLEDTAMTSDDLRALGLFSNEEIGLIELLTKDPNLSYAENMLRVRSSRHATSVKLADIRDNLDPERMARLPMQEQVRLRNRYQLGLSILYGIGK